MSNNEIYIAIAIMAIANLLTRALPFLFFNAKQPPSWIVFIEINFPPIIMTILIFYTIASIDFVNQLYGLKEFLGILFTAFLHIWFNNYLVSIFLGTLFYMGMVQFI
jgi:branched-subunit amino acid transport protein AzlD